MVIEMTTTTAVTAASTTKILYARIRVSSTGARCCPVGDVGPARLVGFAAGNPFSRLPCDYERMNSILSGHETRTAIRKCPPVQHAGGRASRFARSSNTLLLLVVQAGVFDLLATRI